jgi:hypothetical protein
VNTYCRRFAETSFGGRKQSGFGREFGVARIKEYLATKRVAIDCRETFHLDELFAAVPDGEVELASGGSQATRPTAG